MVAGARHSAAGGAGVGRGALAATSSSPSRGGSPGQGYASFLQERFVHPDGRR